MGFRQSKSKSRENTKWKKFISQNYELISETGLPDDYTNTLEWFQDFLMHGYIDHHINPHEVAVGDLTDNQADKFALLIDRFFEFGYDDPGIRVITNEKRQEYAERYPKQFYPY